MIARLLNMLGAYVGPEGSGLAANAENPKGFWERTDIVALNDRILAEADARWFDPYPWLTRSPVAPSASVSRAIRERLLDLDGHRPWFIKDPRLCLTLGAWLPHCERPVVVVCSRDARAVASSLVKHSTSLGFRLSREEADALWETYARSLLQAIDGIDCIYLRYEDVLASPMTAVERLLAELGNAGVVGLRRPDRREVYAFVDRELQHHGAAPATPSAGPSVAAGLRGEVPNADLPPLPDSTMPALAALHERLKRMDEVGISGIRDRDEIEAIQSRMRDLSGVLGDHDFSWSMQTLRRLVNTSDQRNEDGDR